MSPEIPHFGRGRKRSYEKETKKIKFSEVLKTITEKKYQYS